MVSEPDPRSSTWLIDLAQSWHIDLYLSSPRLMLKEPSSQGGVLDTHYKKTTKILREKIVGISSEYRYSDDIPTKQVVGNNSSEFLLSSEIPRNFPTEFRGNKIPRKFRGSLVCQKCPRNIPRENFVGIFPRTFIDRCVLDIYTSIDRNIPTELFPRIIPYWFPTFSSTRGSASHSCP